jgi:long-chain acyl-CoA synthetase
MNPDSSFSVASLLLRTVERHPGDLALVAGEARLTYAELGARVTALADAWFAAGVRSGDRVVIYSHTSELAVLAYFASQLLGAVAVPINFRLAPGEVEYIVRDAGARVLVFGARLAANVERLPAALLQRLLLLSERAVAGATAANALIAEGGTAVRWQLPLPHDLAALVYTSGTTGRPKGVMHTHANDVAIATNCVMEYSLVPTDRALHICPLYHVGGMQAYFLPHLAVGAANVLHESYTAEATLAAIEAERISTLFAVPTQIVEMLHDPRFTEFNLRSLRMITTGGAAIAEATMERVVREFCPQVFNGYGMTEASLTLLLHPRHALERLGSVGKPTLISRCRLVRDLGADPLEDTAADEVGQLIVQGPQVTRGYWNLPEETSRRLKNGWLHTGDLFRRDADGFFHFCGRADDMIVSGGENIYPREVEEVLHRCAGVKDAAVVGLPDAKWGAVVTAFVVRSDAGLTAEAIERFFKTSGLIAAFKRPKRVIFVEELPTNPSGKVLKRELLAQYGAQEQAA